MHGYDKGDGHPEDEGEEDVKEGLGTGMTQEVEELCHDGVFVYEAGDDREFDDGHEEEDAKADDGADDVPMEG